MFRRRCRSSGGTRSLVGSSDVPGGLGVAGLVGGVEEVGVCGLLRFRKPILMYPASLLAKYWISTDTIRFPNPDKNWKYRSGMTK